MASLRSIKGWRMSFIIVWKVASELHSPKNMTSSSKESSVCGEGCLPLIPFFQSNIVEAPTEVQGSEPFHIAQPGEHIGDQWKQVGVLHHDLVQLPVVLYKAEGAFLLLDEEHRSSDQRLQQADSL